MGINVYKVYNDNVLEEFPSSSFSCSHLSDSSLRMASSLSLALRYFASLEIAASFFPCATLLGSLIFSFTTEVILGVFSSTFVSIYLKKFS